MSQVSNDCYTFKSPILVLCIDAIDQIQTDYVQIASVLPTLPPSTRIEAELCCSQLSFYSTVNGAFGTIVFVKKNNSTGVYMILVTKYVTS